MSRPPSGALPRYALHKPSGQARVRLPDGQGGRKEYYLGRYGSDESYAEYTRLIRWWAVTPSTVPRRAVSP